MATIGKRGEIMPFIVFLIPLMAQVALVPLCIKEEEKEKQVNEICIKNYKKPEELRICKDILLNRNVGK